MIIKEVHVSESYIFIWFVRIYGCNRKRLNTLDSLSLVCLELYEEKKNGRKLKDFQLQQVGKSSHLHFFT